MIQKMLFSGIHEGSTVSVFVDTDKLCRKGLAKRFDGSKLFVGNGVAAVSRQDIFAEGGKVRYVYYYVDC